MRHVDGLYTQRFNRSHGRDGSLFRGRYRAILIDADEYLAAVVRYIHLNPVEARVVKLPEQYRWSSHKLYLQPPKVPGWLKVEEVLEQLGGSRGFQEFVLSGNEEELERFYKTHRQSPVLGGEGFVERVRGRIGKVAREHPRYERAKVAVGPQEIIRRVARMYKVEEEEVLRGNRGRENEARKVAMYLVRRCCDRTLEETAQLFGLRSYGTVGWASHGVQSKVAGEREFRDRVEKIIQRIYQPKT
jgi:putative transposase